MTSSSPDIQNMLTVSDLLSSLQFTALSRTQPSCGKHECLLISTITMRRTIS